MATFIPKFLQQLTPAYAGGLQRFHLPNWPKGSNAAGAGLKQGTRYTVTGGGGVDPEDSGRQSHRVPDDEYHRPVLLEEVTHYLQPSNGKLYLDGTLGGGGHTEQLLAVGAKVIGLDQDPAALSFARARLDQYRDNFGAIQGNFRKFGEILETIGIKGLDGVLLDLGVSSKQLDDPDRGFAFSQDGPLDMRMDPDSDMSAADLVNTYEEEELANIIYQYGEERGSRRIAKAICLARRQKPVETTAELAKIVESVKPRRGKIHPATQTFQALRIAVNDELRSLEAALAEVPKWLRPGGRLVIISFHSLEDRIVKTFLRRCSREFIDRPEWPEPRKNPDHNFKLVIQKGLSPSSEEVKSNPRARSARLRVAERLPNHTHA
ncbi:MAG: 16S rRNA (cytosine1402-N4)-methyltransferase [Pseudoalteromonas tetraodonis]|jgi:16S rRNA (cytosine1402-N4)-methyltransferase